MIFGKVITQYHGYVRELRGDALLAEFERASDAVSAALAFQIEQREYNHQLEGSIRPEVRIGIAMGEVVVADDTVTGGGVVLAQRVERLAEPNGLCVTAAIHEALPKRMPFIQASLGEQEFKGFDEQVRVYRVALKPGESIPPPGQTDKPQTFSWTGIPALGAVAIVLVAVIIGAVWLQPWVPMEEPASVENMALPLPDKPSIAVLPFNNMSDDVQQEYFVDGMTEDLITDLSKLSGLFVIARNSVFTYKDKPVKVRQVAEELGVRYVMEGSVRRVGNQVRINAQLIDATTGGHLWAERYDGSLDDVFALQDQVTGKIVSALQVELTPEEAKGTQGIKTRNTEAYDEYLKGQEQFHQGTPQNYAESINHFERTIRLDPDFGQAHASLAAVYWNSATKGWSLKLGLTYDDAASLAKDHLDQAMRNPSPLAHQVASERAADFRPKADEALAEAEMAIALDANDPAGYLAMANALIEANRPKEAVESIQHAMRLNPHYPASYLTRLGKAQMADRQFEMAAATLESAITRNPQDDWAMVFLAAVYGHLDQKEKADAILKNVGELRASLGKGSLTWESVDVELFRSRGFGGVRFTGMRGGRDIVRDGLLKAGVERGFEWIPLVTTVEASSSVAGSEAEYQVEGATTISVEAAKELHARGVPFVETAPRVWLRGHVPGAHLMDWFTGEFNKQRLSQVIDNSGEVVISGWYFQRHAASASAAAVSWGFKNVYYFPAGLRGWQRAGYPVEKEN